MIERQKTYAEDTINQLDFNISSIIEGIKKSGFSIAYNDYIQEYLVTEISLRKIELRDYITDSIKYIVGENVYITDVVLLDTRGSMAVLKSSVYSTNFYGKLINEFNFENDKLTKPIFTGFVASEDLLQRDSFFAYVVPVYYAGEKNDYSGRIGTVIVISNTRKLSELIEKMKISESTKINILDNNNRVVMSNVKATPDNKQTDINNMKDKGKYISITCPINDISCRIECKTPLEEINDDMAFLVRSLIMTAVVMAALLVFIGIIININITSPVARIVKAIRLVGEKNLKQRINLKLDGEIGFISQNINIMLDRIEQMTKGIFSTQERLYQLEILEKQAELSALQSQINPHFLYNTLECIRSIGTVYDINEIVEISTAMADIFRYSIKGGDFVTIEDEINIINKYFSIITIRFLGRFTFVSDIAEEIKTYRLPRMVLQPIIENAVYHGLEKKDDTGRLSLKGTVGDGKITFIIEDDGVGILPDELDRLNNLIEKEESKENTVGDKRSIGLVNISSRIKMLFGKDYGLKIDSWQNMGTKVTVTFPVLKQ